MTLHTIAIGVMLGIALGLLAFGARLVIAADTPTERVEQRTSLWRRYAHRPRHRTRKETRP